MAYFPTKLLLASTLIAVPATTLVAAPASAQVASLTSTSATTVSATSIKTVVLSEVRSRKSGSSVKRYQLYLRRYAKKVGINYRRINRSGATGYYGTETRNLTRAVTRYLATQDESWIPRSKSNASMHPNRKFLKLIGLQGVSAPVISEPETVTGAAVAAWPAIASASITSKPSKWRGPTLRHPATGNTFSYNVSRWANITRAVMREHGIADKYLVGILAQIQQESSGDPNCVNDWDINAKNGTPSKGLLQVILPTYRYYAKRGYKASKYQAVPYTNIWAALNYVKGRYGMSKFSRWNAGSNEAY